MYNIGFMKAIFGILKYYKIKIISISFIIAIATLILLTLLNFYNFFTTYKQMKSGFIPNEMILSDHISNKKDFLNSFYKQILKDSVYGTYTTDKSEIKKYGLTLVNDKDITFFHIYPKKMTPLYLKQDNITTPIDIIDIKQNNKTGIYTLKCKYINIKDGNTSLMFNKTKAKVKVKSYKRSIKIIIDSSKVYKEYYKLMKEYFSQLIPIDRFGIEKRYIASNKVYHNELSTLRMLYDEKFRNYIYLLLNNKYYIASRSIYDELSTFHSKMLIVDMKKNGINYKPYIINKFYFPNENKIIKKINYSFINIDNNITKGKHFLFYYGSKDFDFKNSENRFEIISNNIMIPSFIQLDKIVKSALIFLTLMFILIIIVAITTLLHSFYKSYAREIYFLKSYGFTFKIFTMFIFISISLGLLISYIVALEYFEVINTILKSYFFIPIEFSFYPFPIVILFISILIYVYLFEKRKFDKLKYSMKEEL